jgi:hypothetical protein
MEQVNAKITSDPEKSKLAYGNEKMNEEQNKNTEEQKLLRLETGYGQHASHTPPRFQCTMNIWIQI